MKGFVYLLTSVETGKGYVGSTINLKSRLRRHRSEKYNNCKSKLLGEFTHSILEEYINDYITDKDEFLLKLELVERKWQDLYWDNLVNEKRSQTTLEEERERSKEYSAKYRAEHSEKVKEYDAKYRAEHSEQKKEYDAKYRAEHSEKIKEKLAKYQAKNSEKFKEKFSCECGGKYTYQGKSHHFKTKKHQEYLISLLPL